MFADIIQTDSLSQQKNSTIQMSNSLVNKQINDKSHV